MDVAEFAREHVRPKQLESVRLRVEKNSPPKGEPFSFQELEAMGQPADLNAKWDAEQFRQRFREALAPLEQVSSIFTQQMTTDAQLKEAVQKNAGAIDFYLQFTEHEPYYRDYLSHWRGVSVYLPLRLSSEFVQLLRDWKRAECPKLVPTEEEFKQIQGYARGRHLTATSGDRLPQMRRPADFFSGRVGEQTPKLTLSLPGAVDLPGYDPSREGTLLFSYAGYAYFMNRVQEQPLSGGEELLLPLDPRERMLRSLRKGSPSMGMFPARGGDGFLGLPLLSPGGKEERDDPLRRMHSQGNGRYFDVAGNTIPILSLRGRTDLVALTPQEVGMLFGRLNLGMGSAPLLTVTERRTIVPISAMPKFLPLQQYLLQSRLFIIHDPQPQQPQLPLDLSGTSIRLPLPSAN